MTRGLARATSALIQNCQAPAQRVVVVKRHCFVRWAAHAVLLSCAGWVLRAGPSRPCRAHVRLGSQRHCPALAFRGVMRLLIPLFLARSPAPAALLKYPQHFLGSFWRNQSCPSPGKTFRAVRPRALLPPLHKSPAEASARPKSLVFWEVRCSCF